MAMGGQTRYHSGLSAEETVARHYCDLGGVIAARRWRGTAGEIDLIARQGGSIIFIEVKKSSTFARAAERLGSRQIARIHATASEFLAGEPDGQDTLCRFDVALVDGVGRVEIIENVIAA